MQLYPIPTWDASRSVGYGPFWHLPTRQAVHFVHRPLTFGKAGLGAHKNFKPITRGHGQVQFRDHVQERIRDASWLFVKKCSSCCKLGARWISSSSKSRQSNLCPQKLFAEQGATTRQQMSTACMAFFRWLLYRKWSCVEESQMKIRAKPSSHFSTWNTDQASVTRRTWTFAIQAWWHFQNKRMFVAMFLLAWDGHWYCQSSPTLPQMSDSKKVWQGRSHSCDATATAHWA